MHVTLLSDPGSIREEWIALVRRTGAPVWMRPGWIQAWMAARGTGSLEVLACRGPAGLTGVAAVQRKPGGFGSTSIVWQSIVADDEEARESIAAAIVRRGGARMALQFGFPGTSGLDAMLHAAQAAGYDVTVVPYLRSPFIRLTGVFTDYLATRSRDEMRELLRRRRQLQRVGELTYEVHDGTERLHALLAEGFEVEASRKKKDSGTAIVAKPESVRFYTELARWAADEGLLRLAFLRLNGRAIAFSFMMEDDHNAYGLKGGYSEEFSRCRPGFIALIEAIRVAYARGCRTLQLLGNDEPWKQVWSHGAHDRVTLLAFAPALRHSA